MITELGLDCGDVCLKKIIPLTEDTNCEELFEKVSALSPELLINTLKGLVSKSIKPEKQCDNGVCMASKLTKEETLINWDNTAENIHNLVRGIYKAPCAYFIHNGKNIKVLETKVNRTLSGEAGKIINTNKYGITFGCGRDSLTLIRVKPEGKGEMLARDWYNGVKNK